MKKSYVTTYLKKRNSIKIDIQLEVLKKIDILLE